MKGGKKELKTIGKLLWGAQWYEKKWLELIEETRVVWLLTVLEILSGK